MVDGESVTDDEECALKKLKENKCLIANAMFIFNDKNDERGHYITLMS